MTALILFTLIAGTGLLCGAGALIAWLVFRD